MNWSPFPSNAESSGDRLYKKVKALRAEAGALQTATRLYQASLETAKENKTDPDAFSLHGEDYIWNKAANFLRRYPNDLIFGLHSHDTSQLLEKIDRIEEMLKESAEIQDKNNPILEEKKAIEQDLLKKLNKLRPILYQAQEIKTKNDYLDHTLRQTRKSLYEFKKKYLDYLEQSNSIY